MRGLEPGRFEWPTLAMLGGCYLGWGLGVFTLPGLSLWLSVFVAGLAVALHASLQHEAIHGHPTRSPALNAALVFPNLGLLIPYARFRDTHLAHHQNAGLTDPYDDPESNYLAPAVWARLPRAAQAFLRFNNTLLGRVTVGVAVSQAVFISSDWRKGGQQVWRGWLWHLPAAGLVLAAVTWSPMPLWAYLLAVYAGLSLVKIRTFLEHQAAARACHRTVLIEDRGPLSWLFLNNNLHVVHHAQPALPWYKLPAAYAVQASRYRAQNGGYVYRSYARIIARHMLRAKDPVPHPGWRGTS